MTIGNIYRVFLKQYKQLIYQCVERKINDNYILRVKMNAKRRGAWLETTTKANISEVSYDKYCSPDDINKYYIESIKH